MPVKGIIFDIKKYSIHDGPGTRTTVHLKGCPLSCWWCHNPESQAVLPAVLFRPERCIACGTCVEYFGVKNSLAVGMISNMYTITKYLSEAGHVVYP